MLKYFIALVEREGHLYTVKAKINDAPEFIETDIEKTMYRKYEEFIQELNDGRIVKYIETTDRGKMLAETVDAQCRELKDLVKHHNKLLTYFRGSLVQDEIYNICASVQETLMKKLGKNTFRLMNYNTVHNTNYEVDELALQCFDMFRKEMEAKEFKRHMIYGINNIQH